MKKLMQRWARETLDRARSEIRPGDGVYVMAVDTRRRYCCGHWLPKDEAYEFGWCRLASLDISFVVFTAEMWRRSRDSRVVVSFWAEGTKRDEVRLAPPADLEGFAALDRLWTELFESHRIDVWRDSEIALSA